MIEGVCHLCGETGTLTFEHVPPRAAFNNQRIFEADIHRVIRARSLDEIRTPQGKYNQKGAGHFTLCVTCNNRTGDWYGGAYVRFARLMMPYAHKLPRQSTLLLSADIHPMRVLKQILVMFCSANPPGFAPRHRLPRYLLNTTSREHTDLRLFMALYDINGSNVSRQSSISGRLSNAGQHIYSEICFPPFIFVLASDGGAPDPRLFEISWFREYDYSQHAAASLTLRCLPVNIHYPADYRTMEEIEAQGRASSDDNGE